MVSGSLGCNGLAHCSENDTDMESISPGLGILTLLSLLASLHIKYPEHQFFPL